MPSTRASRIGDAENPKQCNDSRNASKSRQLENDDLNALTENPNIDWEAHDTRIEALEDQDVADDVADQPVAPPKHIHPCICDIDKRRMAAIREHLKLKRIAQQKFESRLRQIEEEFRLAEEAELERIRQLEEEKELYGDEYEQEGKQKKRKKRSARRASMVSLGVKQVINWKRSPKIAVKYTKTSQLRKENPTYCKPLLTPLRSPQPPVNWSDYPKIPIRTTKTVTLRNLEVQKKLAFFQKQQTVIKYPNRPPFIFAYYG